jgi:hypothetical protein
MMQGFVFIGRYFFGKDLREGVFSVYIWVNFSKIVPFIVKVLKYYL